MGRVIYFDICAMIVLTSLILSMYGRSMHKGRVNRSYIALLYITLFTAVADLCSTAAPVSVRELFVYAYYLLRNLNMPFYLIFMYAYTGTSKVYNSSKKTRIFLSVPWITVMGIILTNPWHHMFFTMKDNISQRGPLIVFQYAVAVGYIIFAAIYVIRCRFFIEKRKIVALLSMIPFNLCAVIVQFFYHDLLVEMFFMAQAELMISMIVLRPEEIIDPNVGSFNSTAFENDITKAYSTGQNMRFVFIKMTEYRWLDVILGLSAREKLLSRINDSISEYFLANRINGNVYYLNAGLFAMMLESEDDEANKKHIRNMIDNIRALDKRVKLNSVYLRAGEDIKEPNGIRKLRNIFGPMDLPENGIADIRDLMKKEDLELRLDLDDLIRDAIVNRKFEMYFQPIYSINDKAFTCAEALIRFNSEKYGFIPPDMFITAAEKSGAIHDIGDFVIEDVTEFMKETSIEDYGIEYIEINLSVEQCMNPNLRRKVLDSIEKARLTPERINLEITETADTISQDIFGETLNTLHDDGISFSLDDYGTGYSNIRRVLNLPLDIVKIDKSLIDRIDNPATLSIIRNTVKTMHSIGRKIVAEGVETDEVFRVLTDIGCDYIQGYYFCRPLPKRAFLDFLSEKRAAEKA